MVTRWSDDRVAIHTALCSGAAASLEPALRAARWAVPEQPYVPNVLGRPLSAPDPE